MAWHGVWGGSWLLLKRISRCHPLGGHGIDFVPLPLASYVYQFVPSPVGSQPRGWGIYRCHKGYSARLNHLMRVS